MGPGGSQEAAYTLKAIEPAGTYHFVLDAVIVKPVDVTFDLLWRRVVAGPATVLGPRRGNDGSRVDHVAEHAAAGTPLVEAKVLGKPRRRSPHRSVLG